MRKGNQVDGEFIRPVQVAPTVAGKYFSAVPGSMAPDTLAINTASAVTYTVDQLTRYNRIARDCNGAGRTDTTPTAALIAGRFPQLRAIGDALHFPIVNTSDAGEVLTIAGGSGVTLVGVTTIAALTIRTLSFIRTSAAGDPPAFTLVLSGASPLDLTGPLVIGNDVTTSGDVTAVNADFGGNVVTAGNSSVGGDVFVVGSTTLDATSINTSLEVDGTVFHVAGSAAPVWGTNETAESTAGDVTYLAAALASGYIARDPNGAARADATDTGSNIDAALPDLTTGNWFDVAISNVGAATEDVVLTGGTGVTGADGSATIGTIEDGELVWFRVLKVGVATYRMTVI